MRRVAVLVNRNAQRVTPGLLDWFAKHVPAPDLYVTGSLDDAQAAARAIAAGGYQGVAVGGGDGAFMQLSSDLLGLVPHRLPVMFPLRLGTGNAISDEVGASALSEEGLAVDLAYLASASGPVVPLRLLEVEGELCHFSGTGLDANYADDFRWLVKDRLSRTPLAPLVRGVPGLFITAAGMTVPKLFARSRPVIRVVNAGGPAFRLGQDGAPEGEPIPPGGLLHEGELTIAAAATITQYARGMTFFPFADRLDGAFQLRLSSAGTMRVLGALPSLFKGTYYNPKVLWDFAVTGVRFELAEMAVYHVGGDLRGPAREFTVKLSRHTVPLLRRRAVASRSAA